MHKRYRTTKTFRGKQNPVGAFQGASYVTMPTALRPTWTKDLRHIGMNATGDKFKMTRQKSKQDDIRFQGKALPVCLEWCNPEWKKLFFIWTQNAYATKTKQETSSTI